MIRSKLDGIGWFTHENVHRLIEKHPEVEFHLLFDRPTDYVFAQANAHIHILKPKARHPIAMIWWMEVAVKKALDKINPDVFVSCDGFMSLRSKVPAIAVIHDINFEHYPQDVPWYVRIFYKWAFPKYSKRANRIATVSEFSKADISSRYEVVSSKIDVVFNGVNSVFKPLDEFKVTEVRNEVSFGEPYFVFVGSLHPRKNVTRLLKAFDQYKKEHAGREKLMVIGDRYYWTQEMEGALNGMSNSDDVIFTGRMDEQELAQSVAASLAMVYVPYFEGFGIPILEAFASGVPLITSNITSMPEVALDAALLVDPFDESAIARAMKEIASNTRLRQELVEKGHQRLKAFSWDLTSDKLWESIKKTAC